MSWFTDLFSGGASSIVSSVGDVVDRFVQTDDEKAKLKLALEQELTKKFQAVEESARTSLQARERILVAELQQGDTYTKRARPTVVYFGLVMIALNYFVVPLITQLALGKAEPFPLPGEFWAAWGGIVGTWAIGRSFEKRGVNNQITRAVTGEPKRSSLLDEDISQ